ncbi:MAG: efflux RND transporter periplasmic adaptor subunit [Anaerolineales bacterium]|jgi:multidrug resistance efflux pump
MKQKRPPILLIVIVVVVVLVGGYFGVRALLNRGTTTLTASGTLEAVEVTISPEIGGKVAEVPVDEGAQVKAGDVLFRLDDTLMLGQRAVAAASLNLAQATASTGDAALATAQGNYTVALDAARLASVSTRTSDWWAANPDGYTLPGGYFSRASEIAAAQAEVNSAVSACDSAQNSLTTLINDPANSVFVAAETRLNIARAAFLVAQDVLTRANASSNFDLRDAAQSASDAAQTELDDAQAGYDGIKDTDAAGKIITSRAYLSALQERSDSAQDRLLALQTGENSPQVAAAQAVLNQAQAAADQAALAITQAKASLALIDIQITKLTITAPADGVVLTRSIQPGEIAAPNSPTMTLGRLDNLTITVYVPENLYGELSLGQSATMTVDSYPGETFTAKVINIAEQAEFTPRNVQTVEGRSSTVFAIKLQVQDPAGKLKPGMPADVAFTR